MKQERSAGVVEVVGGSRQRGGEEPTRKLSATLETSGVTGTSPSCDKRQDDHISLSEAAVKRRGLDPACRGGQGHHRIRLRIFEVQESTWMTTKVLPDSGKECNRTPANGTHQTCFVVKSRMMIMRTQGRPNGQICFLGPTFRSRPTGGTLNLWPSVIRVFVTSRASCAQFENIRWATP